MGVNDFGNILVMPRAVWDDSYTTEEGRAAPFSHDRENASPGTYSVTLDDDGTEVAIAASAHGAIHRYRFTANEAPTVLLDLGHTLGTVEIDGASLEVDLEAGTVDAYQLLVGNYSDRAGGIQTWAHLSFEPAPSGLGSWTDTLPPTPDQASAQGETAGAWLSFPPGTDEVLLRVALSHVDAEGARGNHDAELAGRDFAAVLSAAEDLWRERLSGVRVRGGSEEQRVIFHTALHHVLLSSASNRTHREAAPPPLTPSSGVSGSLNSSDGDCRTATWSCLSMISL